MNDLSNQGIFVLFAGIITMTGELNGLNEMIFMLYLLPLLALFIWLGLYVSHQLSVLDDYEKTFFCER